jgi:hypothetical protein
MQKPQTPDRSNKSNHGACVRCMATRQLLGPRQNSTLALARPQPPQSAESETWCTRALSLHAHMPRPKLHARSWQRACSVTAARWGPRTWRHWETLQNSGDRRGPFEGRIRRCRARIRSTAPFPVCHAHGRRAYIILSCSNAGKTTPRRATHRRLIN